jgi:hypothetical protein
MNFGKEFWLILCQEYINSKLFAVSTDICGDVKNSHSFDGPLTEYLFQKQGARVQIQNMMFNIFSSLGALVQIWFS